MSRSLGEKCGVFGVYGHPEASALVALGLHALQHRGQEAAGIVSFDGTTFFSKRALGLVDQTFNQEDVIERLKGHMAIGHNRYATTGQTLYRNIQPLYADLSLGGFALGQNGNLTNAHTLREQLVQKGSIFQSTTDTEVFMHLVAASEKTNVKDRVAEAVKVTEGGFAIVACCNNQLIGLRDRHGIRPLCLGRLNDTWLLSSETCAFDIVGADYVRDVKPGEMVVIDKNGIESVMLYDVTPPRFCIFEYIYFARPDSFMEERSVYVARKAIGAELARESPVDGADVVVPVPDSGVPSAIGYSEQCGVPFELGIIRNHYVGRTFIEPTQQIRHLGVKLKHNANKSFLEGKSVVLVDDTIVRGTTSRKIVEMVRHAGAKEVHMRISAPPTKYSCYYGIDTPSSSELLANQKTPEEIGKHIGVDSLAYISLDGLYKALDQGKRNGEKRKFCDACFSGDYPVPLTDFMNKRTGKRITDLG